MENVIDLAYLKRACKEFLEGLPLATHEEIDASWDRVSQVFDKANIKTAEERQVAHGLRSLLAREKLFQEAMKSPIFSG